MPTKTDKEKLISQLTLASSACFDLSMDSGLSESMQNQFLLRGKRLRACLMEILAAVLKNGTPQLLVAIDKLKEVNEKLKNELSDIEGAAVTIAAIDDVVKRVDELMEIAEAFA